MTISAPGAPTILPLKEAGSTNDVAVEILGQRPEISSLLVWTTNQTAGRGSRGRSWLSPKGIGLAISLAMRCPPGPHPGNFCYPLLAAIWLHEALTRTFPRVDFHLKWPNDLLLDGRKLAGILCESRLVGTQATVILGMGLNLGDDPSFAGLDRPYATLAELPFAKEPEMIVAELARTLPELLTTLDSSQLTQSWLDRCGMSLGMGLRIVYEGETLTGHFAGLSPEGSLLLRQKNGETRAFSQALQDCVISSQEDPCC